MLSCRLRLCGQRVGRRLCCESWNPFESHFHGKRKISIGDDVFIGRRVMIHVSSKAELAIGDNCFFTGDAYLRVSRSVKLGNGVGVAEYCTIRDANHKTAAGVPFRAQGSVYAPIEIGNDVWVGSGCRVLMGAKIPDGVVVGANSVVTRSCVFKPGCIYAGAPARFVKRRKPREN